jgi:6-phosphogluconolactonase
MTDPHPQSRRDFVVTSIVSVMGIAGSATGVNAKPPRDDELLYVGTYTEGNHADGIHLVRFSTETGALRRSGVVNAGENPSFLAIHPRGHTLYAVNETTEWEGKPAGGVTAFDIAPTTGDLTRLGQQSSEGGAPCYISIDRAGRAALVANYVGGNIAVLPIQDGAIGHATHVVQHTGKGPNAERQEGPHAHCVVTDPTNRFALAVDLGVDRVLVYRLGDDGRSLHRVTGGEAVLKAGAGPRHIAFHPTLPLVYVANELDSTVSVFRFDAVRGAMTPVETRSTLPARWRGTNYPADIHIGPSGRHLYLSNRGHNSVAVFSVSERTGSVTLEQNISTEGDWPRNFSLDPSGNWLLVANQRSGSVVVLRRDQNSGRLSPTGRRLDVARAVCLRFRAHTGVTA